MIGLLEHLKLITNEVWTTKKTLSLYQVYKNYFKRRKNILENVLFHKTYCTVSILQILYKYVH